MLDSYSAARWLLAIALPVLLAGCGDGGPTRYSASGKVTFQGKPVPTGTIMFTPAGSEGGAIGVADIFDGKFRTRPDKGVPAGKYVARVRGHGEPGAQPDPGEGLPPVTMGPALFDEIQIPVDMPAKASEHTFVLPSVLEG